MRILRFFLGVQSQSRRRVYLCGFKGYGTFSEDVYKRQVYADRSFTFITKTPPAAVLIKKACNIEKASGVPNKTKVAKITGEQIRKIAEQKMPDLNAATVESAISMIAGTARSMGVEVVD